VKDSASIYYKTAVKYDDFNKHDLALKFYLKARKQYQKRSDFDSVAECNLQIYLLLISQKNISPDATEYKDAYRSYALTQKDTIWLINLLKLDGRYFLRNGKYEKAKEKYLSAIELANITKKDIIRADTYCNLGLLYTNYKIDSAQQFFDKALALYPPTEHSDGIFSTYLNYGNLYQKKGNYEEALQKFLKAENITPKRYRFNLQRILYAKIASSYTKVDSFEAAYDYLIKYDSIKDLIRLENQNIAISEITEKYENEKLRTDNIKKNTLLFGSTSLILVIVLIGYFIIKNSRRKRLLALQEKELETQKNLTLLKEHEISTINAMVEGQEKERKRVAEDLHDNLGSVIATLKLHFENLRINREKKRINQETLFDKTENLIDEAYQKVRSIAHAKNAGVIANQGLLVAVKLMAEKVSSANSIQIEVIDYGLEKPIENSLEISLFRIIQELTTNIIKHSKAKNATINISQDTDDITVLIEDDGIGMDTSKIDVQKGMGLHSIKTRVEHLEGSFTIDSTPSKGTTIIINIPI
jgi:hypothetical protein